MYRTLLGNYTGPLGFSAILLVSATLLVQKIYIHHSRQINNNVCISSLASSSKERVCLIGKDSMKSYKIYPSGFFFSLQVPPNKSPTSPSYDGSGTY